VNYANERSQAALERSSEDAYDVIRLTRSKAAVWTVDDVARLIESSTSNFYLFLSFHGNIIMILKDDKNQIDHKTLQRSSLLYCTLFIYLSVI